MTPEEQLALWVAGEWCHNDERDECTPDFGCCQINLRAPDATRCAFFEGNDELRNQMLKMFLGAFVAGKPVYIAGLKEDNDTEQ